MVHLSVEDPETHHLEAVQVVLHRRHLSAAPHRIHRPLHLLCAGCHSEQDIRELNGAATDAMFGK